MKHLDRSACTVSTWVDTHAHLDDRRFDSDREAVLERARESSVASIVTIGVDLPSSRAAVALAEQYETGDPVVYVAVGVQPNAAGTWRAQVGGPGESTVSALRDLLNHPRVVAVGEIGLDYYWNQSPRDVQQAVLEAQLGLAAEARKPVIVHIRDQRGLTRAYDDTLAILRAWLAGLPRRMQPHEAWGHEDVGLHPDEWRGRTRCIAPGVLHCFSGTAEIAQSALDLGFYLGVDGPVTYPNASARPLQALVAELPLERLLLETDCPYLAPQMHRGQRNEPAYLPYIGAKIAELKGIDVLEVAQVTTLNARRLFDLAW